MEYPNKEIAYPNKEMDCSMIQRVLSQNCIIKNKKVSDKGNKGTHSMAELQIYTSNANLCFCKIQICFV